MRCHELIDKEWSIIAPLLPKNSRGVARVDDRRVINGILWRFRTGSSSRDVPERYGPRICAEIITRHVCETTPTSKKTTKETLMSDIDEPGDGTVKRPLVATIAQVLRHAVERGDCRLYQAFSSDSRWEAALETARCSVNEIGSTLRALHSAVAELEVYEHQNGKGSALDRHHPFNKMLARKGLLVFPSDRATVSSR